MNPRKVNAPIFSVPRIDKSFYCFIRRIFLLAEIMSVQRKADVTWNGDLLKGNGMVKTGTGALPEFPVSWASRTEAPGGKTSPEELLAAAHASCYAMSLSGTL